MKKGVLVKQPARFLLNVVLPGLMFSKGWGLMLSSARLMNVLEPVDFLQKLVHLQRRVGLENDHALSVMDDPTTQRDRVSTELDRARLRNAM